MQQHAQLALIGQPGFADAWVTHHRHKLPLAFLRQLGLAAHKRHQAAPGGHPEAWLQ
ncbi:MAG TPA: hypothetical protein VIH59_27620 [Candidatus Tectomicrobia bacterium]